MPGSIFESRVRADGPGRAGAPGRMAPRCSIRAAKSSGHQKPERAGRLILDQLPGLNFVNDIRFLVASYEPLKEVVRIGKTKCLIYRLFFQRSR